MNRAARLTQARLDRAADRLRPRLEKEGLGPVTTVVVTVHPGAGMHDGIRLLDDVRRLQRKADELKIPHRALVVLLDVAGRTGAVTPRQENLLGILVFALAEWVLEIHYPTGEPRLPCFALRNEGWKREGYVPEVEWSLLERDYFTTEGEKLMPEVDSRGSAWDVLLKKCPRIRPTEHAEARNARRWAERKTK